MISYTVSLVRRAEHRLTVIATFSGPTTLQFPSWAPGSYLMREFARHMRGLSAHTPAGEPVAITQESRNTWTVAHRGEFIASWEVYAHEKSVRTPFADPDLVFFLPSNVLLYDPARAEEPIELSVVGAGPDELICCPIVAEGVPGPVAMFTARDLDHLMDSPVAIANFEHTSFAIEGIAHQHYIERGHNGDVVRMNGDLGHIVAAAQATMGGPLPYPWYQFVTLHMARGHGGLEHKDGCVLLRPRLGFKEARGVEEFVTLAAHEHFHAWNVKRIHPDTLGPRFDYVREHHTRDLWWLEGGTVYYEERIAYRSGCVSEERHLERLADLANQLDAKPGRRHLPLEESSFQAWVKLYRPSEDANNSTISYYLKGAVVIWAMDLEILHRTGGTRSVDDVLRTLWERWGRHGVGYPEGALRGLFADVAGGGNWDRWWDAHVRGTDEVALAEALDHAGYDLARAPSPPGAWLGIETSGADRINVEAVREDGPSAGHVAPGDEILAISGERILAGGLKARLDDLRPGTPVEVLISRDARIRTAWIAPSGRPPGDLKIIPRVGIDPHRLGVRTAWLSRSG